MNNEENIAVLKQQIISRDAQIYNLKQKVNELERIIEESDNNDKHIANQFDNQQNRFNTLRAAANDEWRRAEAAERRAEWFKDLALKAQHETAQALVRADTLQQDLSEERNRFRSLQRRVAVMMLTGSPSK